MVLSGYTPQDRELTFDGLLCKFINALYKAIKCNENIKIFIVNVNTVITICCEQEQNMNNLNVDMSQLLYQDLFWSLYSVGISVLLKLVRSGECFITFLAGIWLHPSMDPNVTLQVARLGECSITFLANIRFHPSMVKNQLFEEEI